MFPNEVTSRTASVWLGIANEGDNLGALTLFCNGVNIPLGQFLRHRTTSNTLDYLHLEIPNPNLPEMNLEPRTEYFLELFLDGNLKTRASFRTLPDDLPTVNESPFTVLLASCFCSSRSESVTLGSTYLNLQKQIKIDIKILCGDQVYLDDPTSYFTWNGHFPQTWTWRNHPTSVLADKLLDNYLKTWGQGGTHAGFQQFLQNGANFFSSDDHEFWNNAPSFATLIPDTYSPEGRDWWRTEATNLLKIFQPKSAKPDFNIGALSFFIVDTRVNREGDNFMSVGDRNALEQWVTNLQGVGVLVLGQPIFSEKAGVRGNLTDWNLPDFKQYEDLVRILYKTNHSILMLTGDVHYGRISRCQLKPDIFLYEIISSPTALVNPLVGGKWDPPPGTFPAFGIPGTVQQGIEHNSEYKFTNNHFLTLDFYKDGAKTRIVLKTVEISGNGEAPIPVKLDEFTLL